MQMQEDFRLIYSQSYYRKMTPQTPTLFHTFKTQPPLVSGEANEEVVQS